MYPTAQSPENATIPLVDAPANRSLLEALIKAYISGNGMVLPLSNNLPSLHKGKGFITFYDDPQTDPHGWLLIDYLQLARDIQASGHLKEPRAIDLALHTITPEVCSELLRKTLERVLPPASSFARPTGAQGAWNACLASLGYQPHLESYVGLYRCPPMTTRKELDTDRCVELNHFMHTCSKLSTSHLSCLPTAFRKVVRACGVAFTKSDQPVTHPFDDFSLAWTNTHLLYCCGKEKIPFETYEYSHAPYEELSAEKSFDRLKVENYPVLVNYGCEYSGADLLGLRLAALPNLQKRMDALLDVPVQDVGRKLYSQVTLKKRKKLKSREEIEKNVPKLHTLLINVEAFSTTGDKDNAKTMPVDCLWLRDDMYVKVPSHLQGPGALGNVEHLVAQVATGRTSVELRKNNGDMIKDSVERLWLDVDQDAFKSRMTYTRLGEIFVRIDGFTFDAPYRALLQKLKARYAPLSPGAMKYYKAFEGFCLWMTRGQAGEDGIKQLLKAGILVPRWLQGLTMPLYEGAPVFMDPSERSRVLRLMAERADKPLLAYAPKGSKGRAPNKGDAEEYLVALGRHVFGDWFHRNGYEVPDTTMRKAIAMILMPWSRPSGLVNMDVSPKPFDPDVPTPPQDTPGMAVLMDKLYRATVLDLPPWAANPAYAIKD